MTDFFGGGGASQFGGGFMPSPAGNGNENQYGAGGDGRGKRAGGGNRMETLRAVTIKQVLHDCSDSPDGDGIMLHGAPLTNVTIVARVLSASNHPTRTVYRVTDGTGVLDVSLNTNPSDDPARTRLPDVGPGLYLRAYGPLRNNGGVVSMTAYAVKPVPDFNEVTYHSLQVISQHLHITKGGAQVGAGPQAAGTGGAYGSAAPQGGYYGAPTAGPTAGGYAGGRTGDVAADVLNVYRQFAQHHEGLTPQEVEGHLKAQGIHYTLQQIQTAVEFNANEGHLYSTVGEKYKCAEA